MALLSDQAFMEALGLNVDHTREKENEEEDLRVNMFGLDYEKQFEKDKP